MSVAAQTAEESTLLNCDETSAVPMMRSVVSLTSRAKPPMGSAYLDGGVGEKPGSSPHAVTLKPTRSTPTAILHTGAARAFLTG
jgi:hypothetical protein